jgi:LysM repeat protein
VNDAQITPCPWLLDDAGSIQPDRPRRLSRCGADAARPDLSHQIREGRCLVGAECEVRAAREAALGSLATTLAPHQPIGDPSLLSDGDTPPPAPGRPWARLFAVAALAALLIVGGGPVISAISPVVQSIIGNAESESPAPSSEATGTVMPTESPLPTATPTTTPTATPSATPSPTATPTPSPTATPAPSSGSGATYVVRKDEGLYSIACSLSIGCGEWKMLAELNNIPGPDYVIKPGQVLQLP